MAAVATDRAWGNPVKAFKVNHESFFSHFSQSIRNSIKIIVLIIPPCDNYLMCRHDHARVLLEEQKNSSSPATSPASSQAAFPDDSITRDCVTWTPLPTQYRCLLFQIFHSRWIVANVWWWNFSEKLEARKASRKVEKGVTESDLHRKESFQEVGKVFFENKTLIQISETFMRIPNVLVLYATWAKW